MAPTPFLVFCDTICRDHFRPSDNLRSNLEIICATAIICGPGSFTGPTLLINNINMENFAWKKCRKIFLEAIFLIRENFFQNFSAPQKFPIAFQSIIIQNYDVLLALVLHLNCTVLSQSESSYVFMYIITLKKYLSWYDYRVGAQ